MKEFFVSNPTFTAIIVAVLVALVVAVVIVAIRKGYKRQLAATVYKLVCLAEQNITGTKMGAQRKKQVIEWLHDLIPAPLQIFITEETMSKLIDDAVAEMKKQLKQAAGDALNTTETANAALGGGGSANA